MERIEKLFSLFSTTKLKLIGLLVWSLSVAASTLYCHNVYLDHLALKDREAKDKQTHDTNVGGAKIAVDAGAKDSAAKGKTDENRKQWSDERAKLKTGDCPLPPTALDILRRQRNN